MLAAQGKEKYWRTNNVDTNNNIWEYPNNLRN